MVLPKERGDREYQKFSEDPVTGDVLLNTNVRIKDEGILDAFGKLRISSPFTEFDAKQTQDNLPLLFDDVEETGSGTSSTHSTDTSTSTLAVSLNTAGTRTRQTFRRFNYQPGKSQLIYLTGALVNQNTDLDGITARIGLFDDNNGIFWEVENGVLYAVRRTSTSGSVVNNRTAQASWSVDPLNGTGPSGATLDITKNQIFVIDFEWLGVGRIRWGFESDGKFFLIHTEDFTNSTDVPSFSMPNLPIRYQIVNDGTGPVTSMRCICQSVISEGSATHLDTGIIRCVSTGTIHLDAQTADTLYAAIAIRLKSTGLGAVIKFLKTSMLTTTNDAAEWSVYWNPTVAGSPTYLDLTNSSIQYYIGVQANTVTGGTLIDAGFLGYGRQGGGTQEGLGNELILGAAVNGTRDELVLCVRPHTTGADVLSSLTFRELS